MSALRLPRLIAVVATAVLGSALGVAVSGAHETSSAAAQTETATTEPASPVTAKMAPCPEGTEEGVTCTVVDGLTDDTNPADAYGAVCEARSEEAEYQRLFCGEEYLQRVSDEWEYLQATEREHEEQR